MYSLCGYWNYTSIFIRGFCVKRFYFCGYFHLDLKRWDGDETHEPRPWKGARLVLETAAELALSGAPRKVHYSFLNTADSGRNKPISYQKRFHSSSTCCSYRSRQLMVEFLRVRRSRLMKIYFDKMLLIFVTNLLKN